MQLPVALALAFKSTSLTFHYAKLLSSYYRHLCKFTRFQAHEPFLGRQVVSLPPRAKVG